MKTTHEKIIDFEKCARAHDANLLYSFNEMGGISSIDVLDCNYEKVITLWPETKQNEGEHNFLFHAEDAGSDIGIDSSVLRFALYLHNSISEAE